MMIRVAAQAMGTRFELVLAGPGLDELFLRSVGEEALEIITDWHHRLSAFDRGSITHALNTRAAASPVRVDDDMMELLLACQRLHSETKGAFDITVGPLMRQWGFRNAPPPTNPTWGMSRVALDAVAGTVHHTTPGIELDFGAIAKGHALDLAASIIKDHGITSAFIHGGTSTGVAIGRDPDGNPWRVRIEADGPVLTLIDAAFSVSAPHGRTAEHAGRTLGHVIDPRTGQPAASLASAATIADSARDADAWSTALLVLGERPATMPAEVTSILPADQGWNIQGRDASAVAIPHTSPSRS